MNEIVMHTSAPASILPEPRTYDSAHERHSALALTDMHMTQLALQRDDAIDHNVDVDMNEHHWEDGAPRQVRRPSALSESRGRETPRDRGESDGGFRLFSKDLGPENILADKDLRIVGVVDWKFAYAAPAQFTFDPPLWLLGALREPDAGPGE
ncbi:hypothetical protein B0T25DRAFT_518906 [Lasiosphaeria hispida]|uniref:Aminoglycoside phosphotransferase domain-containing protein n=1 Tax=Lasiosphaeria hispida TaxID=260671 RepID=A0AAJ0HJQ0_9PEZI|nr:hypothetical protein B0T25DRAFT_518906 [Lasiosphaeria hispida]